MKFINNILKSYVLPFIGASLIGGAILSEAWSGKDGPFIAKQFTKSDTIPPEFFLQTDPLADSKGNYLRYKGKIYESGSKIDSYLGDMADVTSEEFDQTREEYQKENEITMLHLVLGDDLANDFIALKRFAAAAGTDKLGGNGEILLKADTSHISTACLDIINCTREDAIKQFIKSYNIKKRWKKSYPARTWKKPKNCEEIITTISRLYSKKLEQYDSFAENLHMIFSPEVTTWRRQTLLRGSDSASHTEIMMIYKILERCGIKYDTGIYTNDKALENLKKTINKKKEAIKNLLPNTIFSYREMCETCDPTLAGFYKFVCGKEGALKTLFVGQKKKGHHEGEEITTFGECNWSIHNAVMTRQLDTEHYINYLSALAKRLIQIDNLLKLPTTDAATTELNTISEDTKKIISENKIKIINEYNLIVGILRSCGMQMHEATIDGTGETLLESLKGFFGSTQATVPGQQPPPPLPPSSSSGSKTANNQSIATNNAKNSAPDSTQEQPIPDNNQVTKIPNQRKPKGTEIMNGSTEQKTHQGPSQVNGDVTKQTNKEKNQIPTSGTDKGLKVDPTDTQAKNNIKDVTNNPQNPEKKQKLQSPNKFTNSTTLRKNRSKKQRKHKKEVGENILLTNTGPEKVPTSNSTPPEAPNRWFLERLWEQLCKIM